MLKVYYKKGVLIPAGITLACNLVYFNVDSAFSNYKSEWLTTDTFFPIMMLMALMNAFIIAMLSLTIFLNNRPTVQSKPFLSALAWFFCPMVWMAAILISGRSELFDFSHGIDSAGFFAVINTAPYIIGSALSYFLFRRSLKNHPITT